MSQLDAKHPTVATLGRLLPEAICVGGCFASSLPHPKTVPRSSRKSVLFDAQRDAVQLCVRELLVGAGLQEDVPLNRGPGGNRLWPTGFVGSLTHKGTVVLGSIAAETRVEALGIDLERFGRASLDLRDRSIAPEGLPPGSDPALGVLISFTAKEAIFKAQYPVTGISLEFSEVRLRWRDGVGGPALTTALCAEFPGYEVRVATVKEWVVSAALKLF